MIGVKVIYINDQYFQYTKYSALKRTQGHLDADKGAKLTS